MNVLQMENRAYPIEGDAGADVHDMFWLTKSATEVAMEAVYTIGHPENFFGPTYDVWERSIGRRHVSVVLYNIGGMR